MQNVQVIWLINLLEVTQREADEPGCGPRSAWPQTLVYVTGHVASPESKQQDSSTSRLLMEPGVGGSEQPWEEDRQICLVLLSTSFWLMYVCYEVHLHDSPTSRSVIPVLWPELTWDWSCKWVHDLMYFKGNSIKFFQVHICSYVWPPAWSPMCWSQLSGPTSLERAKSKGSWD